MKPPNDDLKEPPTSWKYPLEMPGTGVEAYREIGDVKLNAWTFVPGDDLSGLPYNRVDKAFFHRTVSALVSLPASYFMAPLMKLCHSERCHSSKKTGLPQAIAANSNPWEGKPHSFFNPGRSQGKLRAKATRNYYATLKDLGVLLDSLGCSKSSP